MAECMIPECGIKTEPGSTYEDGHRVMSRHLMVHLIMELRALRLGTLSEAAQTPEIPKAQETPAKAPEAKPASPSPFPQPVSRSLGKPPEAKP